VTPVGREAALGPMRSRNKNRHSQHVMHQVRTNPLARVFTETHGAEPKANGPDRMIKTGQGRETRQRGTVSKSIATLPATVSFAPSVLGTRGSPGSVIAKLSMPSHPARDAVAQATLANANRSTAKSHPPRAALMPLPESAPDREVGLIASDLPRQAAASIR
jgi:hypothetical protein